MPSIGSTSRPTYIYDSATDTWIPVSGPQGADGPTGPTGASGAVGATGPTGPAGSSPIVGFTLLNTGGTALTGSTTVTVSSISNQTKLLVLVTGASSANASSEIQVRFNSDSGSNYGYSGIEINGNASYSASIFSVVGGTTKTSFPIGVMGNDAAREVWGSLLLNGGTSTNFKTVVVSGNGVSSTGSGAAAKIYNGIYYGTSAITSVSIISSTGNLDAGTVYVYGSSN